MVGIVIGDVAFEDIVVDLAFLGVGVHGVAAASGQDAIGNNLCAVNALRVDGVAVASVGADPAVVVDRSRTIRLSLAGVQKPTPSAL